ncbi:hypothetical protein QJ856_gp0726 [Tupanvirus deep ocean]|uniref:Uncharacterized protein n=2 Tax=Tupanvirus TaxID=2094720 RepID=A0AC62A8C3_9VIRU|nr:hypothetical protein QJ856_gp0726 [Tupanvirus deep ocean]QKU34025.1 hypothetical protein [Tupanvirus deep ocean]
MKVIWIVVLVIVLIILYYALIDDKQKQRPQYYPETFSTAAQELEQYYLPGSNGADDLLIDTMICDPKCCGDQWPAPYDGLTADELKQTIASVANNGSFVRTNYTCANGDGGVGCPCVTPKAYLNLTNRSQGIGSLNDIEPTFRSKNQVALQQYVPAISISQDQLQMSPYRDYPKMNDLLVQRSPDNLTYLQAYGSF